MLACVCLLERAGACVEESIHWTTAPSMIL